MMLGLAPLVSSLPSSSSDPLPAGALTPSGRWPAERPRSRATTTLMTTGDCKCWVHGRPSMVFYNRVPKCGSTTMLDYIDAASKMQGFDEKGHRRAFAYIRSNDYDANHFHPDRETRGRILREMVGQTRDAEGVRTDRATLFERHIHYLEYDDMDLGVRPTYINLLRDPGTLRASSFYFARECICNQRPGYTDHKGVWQIQDLWCEADWWRRNHSGFCAMDINACYADLDRCREIYPAGALGGTVEIDFLCGTDPVCGTELTPAKFERAKANLRDNYSWVGILENMPDSLRLLQTLLPEMFGGMNASAWAERHIAPDGGNPTTSPMPSDQTLTVMRNGDLLAEYELYDYAKTLLDCKLRACGLQVHDASDASSFALEFAES
jgi:dermatan/chondrotin sulfate uronyl 2-O-sulfotransferase UST